MATFHTPDLDAIRALPNPEIRFYAIVGAVVSLGAALEHSYFDVFEKATQLKQSMAASIFYEIRGSSVRREMANRAMLEALAGRTELAEWTNLFNRIVAVSGGLGERNLVGHNPVQAEKISTISSFYDRSGIGFGPLGMVLGRVIIEEHRFWVSQDPIQIGTGRKPKAADLDSLFSTCSSVIGVLNDLDAWLKRILVP